MGIKSEKCHITVIGGCTTTAFSVFRNGRSQVSIFSAFSSLLPIGVDVPVKGKHEIIFKNNNYLLQSCYVGTPI
jgi:hypothetical protein